MTEWSSQQTKTWHGLGELLGHPPRNSVSEFFRGLNWEQLWIFLWDASHEQDDFRDQRIMSPWLVSRLSGAPRFEKKPNTSWWCLDNDTEMGKGRDYKFSILWMTQNEGWTILCDERWSFRQAYRYLRCRQSHERKHLMSDHLILMSIQKQSGYWDF